MQAELEKIIGEEWLCMQSELEKIITHADSTIFTQSN